MPKPVERKLTEHQRDEAWREWLAAELQKECELMGKTVGEFVADLLEKQRAEFKALLADQRKGIEAECVTKISELKLDLITRMTNTLEAMQRVLGAADAKTIEPASLSRTFN
jgi:hypothetical protein